MVQLSYKRYNFFINGTTFLQTVKLCFKDTPVLPYILPGPFIVAQKKHTPGISLTWFS